MSQLLLSPHCDLGQDRSGLHMVTAKVYKVIANIRGLGCQALKDLNICKIGDILLVSTTLNSHVHNSNQDIHTGWKSLLHNVHLFQNIYL